MGEIENVGSHYCQGRGGTVMKTSPDCRIGATARERIGPFVGGRVQPNTRMSAIGVTSRPPHRQDAPAVGHNSSFAVGKGELAHNRPFDPDRANVVFRRISRAFVALDILLLSCRCRAELYSLAPARVARSATLACA